MTTVYLTIGVLAICFILLLGIIAFNVDPFDRKDPEDEDDWEFDEDDWRGVSKERFRMKLDI